MGAERWLRFSSVKEATRCRKYLAGIPKVEGQDYAHVGADGVGWYGCYIEWHSPTVLWVSYPMCHLSSTIANLVSREIAKRFKVRNVGADSVGWFKEPPAERRAAPDWPTWMATFSIERDVRWHEDTEPALWEGMERLVTSTFEKLDADR